MNRYPMKHNALSNITCWIQSKMSWLYFNFHWSVTFMKSNLKLEIILIASSVLRSCYSNWGEVSSLELIHLFQRIAVHLKSYLRRYFVWRFYFSLKFLNHSKNIFDVMHDFSYEKCFTPKGAMSIVLDILVFLTS